MSFVEVIQFGRFLFLSRRGAFTHVACLNTQPKNTQHADKQNLPHPYRPHIGQAPAVHEGVPLP